MTESTLSLLDTVSTLLGLILGVVVLVSLVSSLVFLVGWLQDHQNKAHGFMKRLAVVSAKYIDLLNTRADDGVVLFLYRPSSSSISSSSLRNPSLFPTSSSPPSSISPGSSKKPTLLDQPLPSSTSSSFSSSRF